LEEGHQEDRLLMNPSQADAFIGVKLLSKGGYRAPNECFRQEGVSKGIAIVCQHQYFVELASGLDCELKDIFLGFGDDAFKIRNGTSDSYSRGVFVDPTNLIPFFDDVSCDFVDSFDQIFLADSFSVHQKHG
jgi:hypothetical protein